MKAHPVTPDLFLGGKWCSAVLNESQSLEPYEGCDRTHGSLGPVLDPGFMLHPFTVRVRWSGARPTVLAASVAAFLSPMQASLLVRSDPPQLRRDVRVDVSADSAEDVHPAWGP